MNVGTTPMFAISFAMISSPFAMIVSPSRKPGCNQFAHACPMIAIPPPDVCRSLQVSLYHCMGLPRVAMQQSRVKLSLRRFGDVTEPLLSSLSSRTKCKGVDS